MTQSGFEAVEAARVYDFSSDLLPFCKLKGSRMRLCILLLFSTLSLACAQSLSSPEVPSPVASAPAQSQPGDVEQELERQLKSIFDRAQGTVGLSVVHIESGKSISINGGSQLPLYSVFKLPLAIAVLKDVEENRLRLDQKIHVTPADIVPGTPWEYCALAKAR